MPALPELSRTQYGEPVRIDDQTTVIPVSRRTIRGGTAAVGILTVAGGEARWTPVIDQGRIALIGVVTGLVAATLGSAAVFRQPPWPKITMTREIPDHRQAHHRLSRRIDAPFGHPPRTRLDF